MVGLNISRSFSEPFRNFHDASARANDFKIRYAFTGTEYYGAYMTDIIKNVEVVKSADLLNQLTPPVIRENTDIFLSELADLGGPKPVILAFGSAAYKLVEAAVPPDAYARLIKVTHYSHQIGKERYRDIVSKELQFAAQPRIPADAGASRRSPR